jgi:hypothetical protein
MTLGEAPKSATPVTPTAYDSPSRIQRGALWLDATFGKDWRNSIALTSLDMNDCYKDIVGQASGTNYNDATLPLTHQECEDFGFYGNSAVENETLRLAWLAHLSGAKE